MTRILKRDAIAWAFLAAVWVATALAWSRLPTPVPTHWGLDGRPNGWMPMPWGGLVFAATPTLVYALALVGPRLDPRRAHLEASGRGLAAVMGAVVAFLAVVGMLALHAAATGAPLQVGALVGGGLGALFMVLGNYMPKLRSNFLVGIRTPWTLSSEAAWTRTHQVAGPWLVALGAALVASTWLVGPLVQLGLLLVGSLAWSSFAIAYSYVQFKKFGNGA